MVVKKPTWHKNSIGLLSVYMTRERETANSVLDELFILIYSLGVNDLDFQSKFRDWVYPMTQALASPLLSWLATVDAIEQECTMYSPWATHVPQRCLIQAAHFNQT